LATGNIIVLMGADTFPQDSWFNDVRKNTKTNEIGCTVSVGLQPGNYDINEEGLYLRYGAKILYTMTAEDLPKYSLLRKDPNYKDILEAKWLPKLSDEPYEIPCCYGAFYFLTREFYKRMHGWDTIEGEDFRGHQRWGCLEPFLSLKASVYGGKSVLYPGIRVGHVFGRLGDIYNTRSVRNDLKFWNKLWIAHTMLDDELRDEVLAFPNHSLNLSQAQAWIKQYWNVVQETRQRNINEGKLISRL
jgi:hypothetical protein